MNKRKIRQGDTPPASGVWVKRSAATGQFLEKSPRVALKIDENPEWTEKDFAHSSRAGRVLPAAIVKALVRPRGRPVKEDSKEAVSIRLSPKVLAHFRASGKGWQTRIDEELCKLVNKGRA